MLDDDVIVNFELGTVEVSREPRRHATRAIAIAATALESADLAWKTVEQLLSSTDRPDRVALSTVMARERTVIADVRRALAHMKDLA